MPDAAFPGSFDCGAADQAVLGQARAMADGLGRTLRLARALTQAGRRVDLAELDSAIGRLCARALDLPPEHGRALRPALEALLAEVEATEALLRSPA